MSDEPTGKTDQRDVSLAKTSLGIKLFVIYTLLYSGFVAINTIWPQTMGIEIIWGLNLAVVYGFGLIFFAIILGLIFHAMCNSIEKKYADVSHGEES